MPTTVNEQTTDAVNLVNVKNVGELHALTAGLAGQHLLNNAKQLDALTNSILANSLNSAQQIQHNGAMLAQAVAARAMRFAFDISAEQAAAFEKTLGVELADKITDLGGAVAGIQQVLKGANTTPPQTGTGGAFGSDSGSAVMQQIVNSLTVLNSRLNDLEAKLQPRT